MSTMKRGAVTRRATLHAWLIAGLILGGCSSLEDYYTADVAFSEGNGKRKVTLPGDMKTFDLTADCIPAHRDQNGNCETITMREFNTAVANSPEAALLRNRFQDYLLWRSEQQCERHKAGILSTQATTNLALNTVTTATSAIAAIVVAPAASILAAIAAITSGTRSHINEDIYQRYLAPAVVKKINSDRENMFAAIMSKRGIPISERPVGTIQSTVVTGATSNSTGTLLADSTTTSTAPAPKPAAAGSKVTTTTVLETTNKNGAVTSAGEIRSVVNYSGQRRVVTLQDYSMEEAIGDVERYHQLCSFSSGLASLIEPGAKFEDSAAGIQQRIDLLRDQQLKNEAQIKLVTSDYNARQRLQETNSDISRQIMTLQQRLLTAPLTVGGKPTGG
jgi:hypothetical protein